MPEFAEIQRCIQTLESSNDESRRQTIHLLKGLDAGVWSTVPRKIVPPLVESLQRLLAGDAKSLPARHEIVVILGRIGPAAGSAVPQLIDLLAEKNADAIREAAASALGRIGGEASPALDGLVELIPHAKPSLAMQAIRAIVLIGVNNDRIRTALTDIWRSAALIQNVRVEVAIALCQLKIECSGVLEFLTGTAAGSPSATERRAAVGALAHCNRQQPDVVPALVRAALNDKDDEVRKLADESLGQLKLTREKAMEICARQLAESVHAETALRHGGELAVPALIDALAVKDPVIKEKAARLLGSLGAVALAAAPHLKQTLRDSNPMLRLAAAKSLWNITNNAKIVTPTLVALLEEDCPASAGGEEARRRHLQTIIEALWRIGPGAELAIPALTAKSKDKNRLISESALSALRVITPAPASAARS